MLCFVFEIVGSRGPGRLLIIAQRHGFDVFFEIIRGDGCCRGVDEDDVFVVRILDGLSDLCLESAGFAFVFGKKKNGLATPVFTLFVA